MGEIVRLPWSDTGYATGSQTGNFAAKAADAAANFACSLARSYPGAVIQNPASEFSRGLWDSVCANRGGSPPEPAQQFTGGQCQCAPYRITYNQVTSSGSTQFTADLVGKIRGLERTTNTGFPITYRWVIVYEPCSGGVPTGAIGRFPINSAASANINYTVAGIARTDGQSDNCGNPPPSYPPVTYNPPNGWQNGTGSITKNNNVTVAIPLVYAPISPQFNGEINVDVGGVKVAVDLGGVTINLDPNNLLPGGSNDSDKIDEIYRRGSGSGGYTEGDRTTATDSNNRIKSIEDTVNNLKDKADEIADKIDKNHEECCDPPPANDEDYDEVEKPESESGSEDNAPRLRYVKILLTKLPPQSQVQWGRGAPNVVFAGWFEWVVDGYALPREPIHFEQSIFSRPTGATGYAYTLTNGARGKAIEYSKKVQ